MNVQARTYAQGMKYRWQLPTWHDDIIALAQRYNVAIPIAQTLYNRGYATESAIDAFLFSSLEKDVASAALFKDIDKAIDRIIAAIDKQEKILIFGDYDVDGITSSALMMICLKPLGAVMNFFLPHRVRDGYGLSVDAVKRAHQNGYKVIITVDNGITALKPAAQARTCGIDLIITDHHHPQEQLPDAYAIINPQQHDCTYPFKGLAGVGVTFKIVSYLYEKIGRTLPSKAYELLLLGTIADVVPLIGENRYWVRHGLQSINTTKSPSLLQLLQNAKIQKPSISAQDIGFYVAPQINALGRLEDPRQGVKFLIGTDQQEVQLVGGVLQELNQARKQLERSVLESVEQEIFAKRINLDQERVILAASDQWQPGVIGLVASRLVHAYGRPTILLHLTSKGKAKGSGRSIAGFNLFNALHECADLLDSFGGHAHAAGLSLSIDKIPLLKERLEKLVLEQVSPDDLIPKIMLDASLCLPDVTKQFILHMEQLEPFGCQNSVPSFLLSNVSLIQRPTLLKDAHVKCMVFAQGIIKPVIFFNRPELFEKLMRISEQQFSFDCAVQVSENHWNDRVSIEFIGLDISLGEVA